MGSLTRTPGQGQLERVAAALAARPGAKDTPEDTLKRCATAWDLIANHIGTAYIPDGVLDEAIYLTVSEMDTRRKSPGGVFAVYGDQEGAVRLSGDPLKMAYPILDPFLPGGFA
jgi:hypothetical protein